MAGNILDMSKFTFCGDTIRNVSELVMDAVLKAPEIALLHTIYPGIVTKTELGFIGEGGLVGKKNQGCNPKPHEWGVNTRVAKFDPVQWEVLLHACWTDLESTALIYSLRTGTKTPDFTETDYMNILVLVLTEAMRKFIVRLLWFNDKDAKNAPEGDFTAALDLDYFNLINGFFKLMAAYVTTAPKQLVSVVENAAASYAEQVLTGEAAYKYLNSVYFGADLKLRGASNGIMLVTQSVADAYEQYLTGKNIESTYKNIIEGIPTLTFKNIPIVAMPVWDLMIAEYQDTGTKLIDPHRIVYTTPEVLGVAVDSEDSFSNIDVWYDRDSRNVKMEGMGRADTQLMNPDLFMLAR